MRIAASNHRVTTRRSSTSTRSSSIILGPQSLHQFSSRSIVGFRSCLDRPVSDNRSGRRRSQDGRKQARTDQGRDGQNMRQHSTRTQMSRIGTLDARLAGRLMRMRVLVQDIPPHPGSPPYQHTRHRNRIQSPKPKDFESSGRHERRTASIAAAAATTTSIDFGAQLLTFGHQSLRGCHSCDAQPKTGQSTLPSFFGKQMIVQDVPGSAPKTGGAHAHTHMGQHPFHIQSHKECLCFRHFLRCCCCCCCGLESDGCWIKASSWIQAQGLIIG